MTLFTAMDAAARVALAGIHLACRAQPGLTPEQHWPAALYLLVTECNVTGASAGRAAGCSKQNIAKHVRRIEEARTCAALDAALATLADALTMGRG